MSDSNEEQEVHKYYALTIGEEIVWTVSIPDVPVLEGAHAAWASDPTVVPIPEAIKTQVNNYTGWTYVNGEFVPPTE